MIDVPPILKKKPRDFPLEKVVEKELVKRVKQLGGDCSKFSSPNNRGVFDQIILTPDANTTFVEVKAEKGKPSHKQAVFAGRLDAQNQRWCYVYGMTGVDEFMHDLHNNLPLKQVYHEPVRRKPVPHITKKD